jgi:hypothetical protein
MDGYLSKKPKLSFVDDLGKLYRQRRCATQAKGLETLDRKVEGSGCIRQDQKTKPACEDQKYD